MQGPDNRAIFIDGRLSAFLRESHELMLEMANLKAYTRILVVECRDGWAAEEASRRMGRGYVCGVDVSHPMITLARQYREAAKRLEFSTWDRRTLPFDDGSFDVALVPFSIHRFQDPIRVLGELVRTIRPDGKVLVLESTRYGFLGLYAILDFVYRHLDDQHVRYYSTTELTSMMTKVGFERLRVLERFNRFNSGGKIMAHAVLLEGRLPPPVCGPANSVGHG